ncbi:MAG: mechanosensitive ion channel family protein [Rhodobiaceae bacterium]|nr:mechanosensitive ion channel family protein [Rhodobiaceae bacterium]
MSPAQKLNAQHSLSKAATYAFVILLGTMVFATSVLAGALEPAWKFKRQLAAWDIALTQTAQQVALPEQAIQHGEAIRQQISDIRTQASDRRDFILEAASDQDNLLAALGLPPEEGEAEESRDVQKQRRQFESEISDYLGRAAQTHIIIRRSDTLLRDLTLASQNALIISLSQKTAPPLSWSALTAAFTQTGVLVAYLFESPKTWWQARTADSGVIWSWLEPLLVITLAGGLAQLSNRLIKKYAGRDLSNATPTYTRRLLGASIDALTNGLIPFITLLVVWTWAITGTANSSPELIEIANGLGIAAVIFILTTAIAKASLTPDLPNWRVTPLFSKRALHIVRRITWLALFIAIEQFFTHVLRGQEMAELKSLIVLIYSVVAGLSFLYVLQPSLWKLDMEWITAHAVTRQSDKTAPLDHTVFVQTVKRQKILIRIFGAVTALIVTASIISSLLGYSQLSQFLFGNLILTALLMAFFYSLSLLAVEWIDIGMRQEKLQDRFQLTQDGGETTLFWLSGLIRFGVAALALIPISKAWGLPLEDIGVVIFNQLNGIQIGHATIGLTDFFDALIVFLIVWVLFRFAKRILRNNLLPQTRLDKGVQYSITTVFGYIGLITAILLAALAFGIELQNLIIIAGALSVGIGFGLQTIANNFVSGLILLFERPIKVGDLIEINDTLGHVTHINVRRTEVLTFQNAEVMIPNADLVSTSVVNWTHSDAIGRIEINIGVAYGTDTTQVKELLLQAAHSHPRIVRYPLADVLFLDFGDSSLNFQLRCFTNAIASRITTLSDIRFEIDRLFREADIVIPFPQRTVHFASDHPDPTKT